MSTANGGDLGQKMVNLAAKIAIPTVIGLGAWLFGSVASLQNRMTVQETASPYIQRQLERIEKDVGDVKASQETTSRRLVRIEQALSDKDKP